MKKKWISYSEDETAQIALDIIDLVSKPVIICLNGDLGAGKTAFSRAFIRHLMGDVNMVVPSPTYTLVQTYDGDRIWHFDLYRMESPDQLYDIGWEDALIADYCLIEWPERLGVLKPKNTVDITIKTLPDGARAFTLSS